MTDLPDYDAARHAAACLVRDGRGKIAVAGNDRRTYLHAMLTNDIATLGPGSGCYAAYLTPQGRMVTDLRVFELGDLVLLELPGEASPTMLEKLDAFVFTEDVKLGDLGAAFTEVRVVGPRAAAILAGLLAPAGSQPGAGRFEALADWAEHANARARFHDEMVVVVSSLDLGVPGFDLFVEQPHASELVDALLSAGAVALSAKTAETLRIEAGRPLFGVDMDSTTIPLEAGIEARAISFTKGCYPGQEVIVRVVHRGHGRVARHLVGVRLAGTVVPSPGTRLAAAGPGPDASSAGTGGREPGRITSAAWSPLVGAPIALGYVPRDLAAPGTKLTVAHPSGPIDASVVPLPFGTGGG